MAKPGRRRRKSEYSSNLVEFEETVRAVQKRYGDASITKAKELVQPGRISTGPFILDFALLGGIPHNRSTMIVGHRHAGKTTIACKIIANAQQMFPRSRVVFVDVEGTFDHVWAEKLGVDTDKLILFQPDSGEAAVDVTCAFLESEGTSLVVIDSIAALTPMKEIDSEADDQFVGVQARLVGRMVRKSSATMIRERKRGHFVTLLYLNQYRSKIGGFSPHGEPLSIPGGRALEFCTTVQLVIKNKENKGKDEFDVETMGANDHSFSIQKNKINSGPRAGEFRLIRVADPMKHLEEGDIDDSKTVLTYAKKFEMYTGTKKQVLVVGDDSYRFGSTDEAAIYLNENRDVYNALRRQIIRAQAEHLGMPDYFLAQFDE